MFICTRYHVTLLGVRSHLLDQILLNPGLDYIMSKNDICYYIGFTREEYSEVGGATSIRHALQQSCAKMAIYSLAVCGIDPHNLDEQKIPEDKPLTKRSSTVSMDEPDGLSPSALTKGKVSFFIPDLDVCEVSTDSDIHLQVLEARRGLHLLKYHSSLDMHANPVVKVNLLSCNVNDSNGLQAYRQVELTDKNNLVMPSGSHAPAMQDDCLTERGSVVDGGARRPSLQRSISEGAHITNRSPATPKTVFYTSNMSLFDSQRLSSTPNLNDSSTLSPLVIPRMIARRPSVWSTLTRTSRISLASLDVTGPDILELELADIEEEEELEGLEDGYCEEQRDSTSRSPSPALDEPQRRNTEAPQRRR